MLALFISAIDIQAILAAFNVHYVKRHIGSTQTICHIGRRVFHYIDVIAFRSQIHIGRREIARIYQIFKLALCHIPLQSY